MEKLALTSAIITIFFLLLYMQFSRPIQIDNQEQLKTLEDNQRVSVSGKVISYYGGPDKATIKLDNNISLICDCKDLVLSKGKQIHIEGVFDSFYNKINILRLDF